MEKNIETLKNLFVSNSTKSFSVDQPKGIVSESGRNCNCSHCHD